MINGNLILKIMRNRESFQHENVFGRQLTGVSKIKPKIYLNLTFRSKV